MPAWVFERLQSYNYKLFHSSPTSPGYRRTPKKNGNFLTRYVKITVHGTYSAGSEFGLPSDATASFYEFKVFGTADGATFHSDANYGGNAVTLDVGNYTFSQLQAAGIADNSISSIQVPVDYKVVAYYNDGFSGTSRTYTSDTPSMSGDDNTFSSIKVIPVGIVSGATYKIKNKDSGKYLDTDANGGSSLLQVRIMTIRSGSLLTIHPAIGPSRM